jgi:hypothetical protein
LIEERIHQMSDISSGKTHKAITESEAAELLLHNGYALPKDIAHMVPTSACSEPSSKLHGDCQETASMTEANMSVTQLSQPYESAARKSQTIDDAPARRRPGMKLAAANSKAIELAKSDPAFLSGSLREWAEAIGCSEGQVAKLDLWIAKQREADHKSNQSKSPRTVSLTGGLLATTPADCDDPLQRLIREQKADDEPSPLEPDPPDKPLRVQLRKKL